MKLVTRSDFDGLVCAVLLKIAGVIDGINFVHPKAVQDSLVEVSSNDVLANVPYSPECGIWFDRHTPSEVIVNNRNFKGLSKVHDSCARVIWEYYGGHKTFSPSLDDLLASVDKFASGLLTEEDIKHPTGWILLGFILDPRTGLSRYSDYHISNYQLMLDLIKLCATQTSAEILANPDVAERVERYNAQEDFFSEMIVKCSTVQKNLLIIDLLKQSEIYTGNRFTSYALFPEANVSMQIMRVLNSKNILFTVGRSIINRSCTTHIGSLMQKYGGGGHKKVGTCQVPTESAEQIKNELITALTTA